MRLVITQVLIASLVMASYATDARGQEVLNRKFSITVKGSELRSILEQVQAQTDARFVFSPSIINVKGKLSVAISNQTIEAFLQQTVRRMGIGYKAIGNIIVLYDARDKEEISTITLLGEMVSDNRPDADRELTGTVTNEKKRAGGRRFRVYPWLEDRHYY